MNLSKDDIVVCAYGQSTGGPGWNNQPLWVIIEDKDKKLRQEAIQPNEFTVEMDILYKSSELINYGLVRAIEKKYRKEKR